MKKGGDNQREAKSEVNNDKSKTNWTKRDRKGAK
jgi:hypothetical protein